jgi:type I site-specific restriction-modification system R (restriction) subunit
MVPRYHQYFAVNVKHIKAAAKMVTKRAGVIGTSRGSGKSLSMVFLFW